MDRIAAQRFPDSPQRMLPLLPVVVIGLAVFAALSWQKGRARRKARPEPVGSRPERLVKRNPAKLVVPLAGIALSVASLALYLFHRHDDKNDNIRFHLASAASALSGSPASPVVYDIRLIKVGPSRLNEARLSSREALRLHPRLPAALTYLGLSYMAEGEDGMAAHFLRQAAIDGSYAPAYVYWAQIAIRKGDSEQALRLSRIAKRLEPSLGPAYYTEALILEEACRDSWGGVKCLEPVFQGFLKAVEVDPHPAALTALARILRIAGRVADARSAIHLAMEIDPTFGPARAENARLLFRTEETGTEGQSRAAALEELVRAIQFAPKDADVRVEYGRLLYRIGRESEALEQLRKAVDVAPGNMTAYLVLAEVLHHRDPAAAVGVLRSARGFGEDPDVLVTLAEFVHLQGDFEEAWDLLDLARRLFPKSLTVGLEGFSLIDKEFDCRYVAEARGETPADDCYRLQWGPYPMRFDRFL